MDTSWQNAIVGRWAKANPARIKSAASATDLERLHKAAEQQLDRLMAKTVTQGNDTWAYVNKY